MKKRAAVKFSFAVGSEYGPRSITWIVSISGEDIYVDSEAMTKAFKVSLHASGQRHITNRYSPPGNHRNVLHTHRDQVPQNFFDVGLYINVPDSCLRRASQVEKQIKPDCWVDRPMYGGVAEISVARWPYIAGQIAWPGMDIGTKPLWRHVIITSNEVVGVLVRHCSESDNLSKAISRMVRPPPPPGMPEPRYYRMDRHLGAIFITEMAND
jgi:hypothetical protein